MIRIGLTGGIGSGKSIVAGIFERLGVRIYNADQKARYLMENDLELVESIKNIFGEKAYSGERLNAAVVGTRVFSDKNLLESLNNLVHPAVRKDFENWCIENSGGVYVLEEAALLFETGFYRNFEYNILVSAPEEIRIERVMQRDGISREEVLRRIANQMPEEEKAGLCDFRIINDESNLIIPQILQLHNKFVSLQK